MLVMRISTIIQRYTSSKPIFTLYPSRVGAFPYVYALGVLQHTPDVEKAFFALPPMVAKGGRICVDFYQKSWKSALLPKYWLRSLTKRMSKVRLFAILESLVPKLFSLSRLVGQFPMGHIFKRLLSVADPIYFYEKTSGKIIMTVEQRMEWSLFDTFDWLSPKFDNPQTPETVKRWMENTDLEQVEVLKAGHLVGRGRAPNAYSR